MVMSPLKNNLHVLVYGKTFQGSSRRDLPAIFHHLVHVPVRPVLTMVEEAEAADAGIEGQAQGVRVDGMAPGLVSAYSSGRYSASWIRRSAPWANSR